MMIPQVGFTMPRKFLAYRVVQPLLEVTQRARILRREQFRHSGLTRCDHQLRPDYDKHRGSNDRQAPFPLRLHWCRWLIREREASATAAQQQHQDRLISFAE